MSDSLQEVYHIREMRLEDVRRIILIEREIFLFPWTEMNFADSITAGYYCRVIELNDLLIGYGIMMIGPDEAHILTIGISAQWQHQGWGRRLLQYFIDLARQQQSVAVLLDVRVSNGVAANLYRQLGFEQIAIRKGYYPAMGGREDALVMRLKL
ncbi:ribosomal protein S18-alanine N-acetyltransferase [Nitrosomonas sp. Is37]|uniref:ribosomal protein S18-alanine N-acetyltransferase n=1 Tax=Nitrosomonas sp. Is37 TaxID=3080535 RepID=UPI00294B64F9|nr:ribosomal protein S18-alanine N-acetyltransferase [Nitrosomonas sp. Is37]MDV6343258.1 ribosomal protein S18-alanine N-acetyltransferase [Nitrosomonas sp. Is37]